MFDLLTVMENIGSITINAGFSCENFGKFIASSKGEFSPENFEIIDGFLHSFRSISEKAKFIADFIETKKDECEKKVSELSNIMPS